VASWAFLLWLIALHIMWHLVIPIKERLMVAQFGDDYRAS
jgi:protein-S-isoprenylcysteine O-methyltransferase Ste14